MVHGSFNRRKGGYMYRRSEKIFQPVNSFIKSAIDRPATLSVSRSVVRAIEHRIDETELALSMSAGRPFTFQRHSTQPYDSPLQQSALVSAVSEVSGFHYVSPCSLLPHGHR